MEPGSKDRMHLDYRGDLSLDQPVDPEIGDIPEGIDFMTKPRLKALQAGLWFVVSASCALLLVLGVLELAFLKEGALLERLGRTAGFVLVGGAFFGWVGIGAWNRAALAVGHQRH